MSVARGVRHNDQVRIAILGPLEVHDEDGSPIHLGGPRLRALLIRLALDPGRVLPASGLVADLWEDDSPAAAANALQSLVSRLRTALGSRGRSAIESSPTGYRLALPDAAIDAYDFGQRVTAGRAALAAGDHALAATTLAQGLALWRGAPLADVDGAEFAQAPAARLDEQRVAAWEDRLEAELALGEAATAVVRLEELVAAYPLRERLQAQHMRALQALGRQADALAGYERTRHALADALGVDPGPQLQAVHLAVLRGEIDTPPAPTTRQHAAARIAPRPGAAIPSSITSFVGRDDELDRIAGCSPAAGWSR